MQYSAETETSDGTRVLVIVHTSESATREEVEDGLSAAYLAAFREIDKTYGPWYVGTNTTTEG